MSPAYGQAANFSFEDAAVLAHSVREAESVEQAATTYSQARVSRCQEMMDKSATRLANQLKGKPTENVFEWIAKWEPTNIPDKPQEEEEDDTIMHVVG